jgi:hypothetical protein
MRFPIIPGDGVFDWQISNIIEKEMQPIREEIILKNETT